MGATASQITSLAIVLLNRLFRPVNSPHKEPVTLKKIPSDDVIMRIFLGKLNAFTYAFWEKF